METLASGVEEGRNIGPNGVITGGNTWRTGLDGGCCGFVGAIHGRHSFEARVTVPTSDFFISGLEFLQFAPRRVLVL